ncbi:MAG TPA: hypothetical protein VF746_10790 [Longimicrobium sp.]|jgi:hypothetical protein
MAIREDLIVLPAEAGIVSEAQARGDDPAVRRITRRKMDAREARELDATPAAGFTLDELPRAEREEGRRLAAAASALMLKGLLHRADPRGFPVAAGAQAPDAVAARLAAELDPAVFARVQPRLERALREPKRLERILGPFAKVDLRRPELDPEVAKLVVRPRRGPGGADAGDAVPRGAKFTRAHLILRALHCVRETSGGGADEMILGGVLVGASGNVKAINSIVCGEFDTGDYYDAGELFLGQYSLRTTAGYPKSLYAIFKLVESDSDDREVAQQLTATLSLLASTILSALASPAVGGTVAAVMQAIGGFISDVIDEDEFPPYGIRLTLQSENQFGGPVGPKERTNDIVGHGGKYRIGYRWVLNA